MVRPTALILLSLFALAGCTSQTNIPEKSRSGRSSVKMNRSSPKSVQSSASSKNDQPSSSAQSVPSSSSVSSSQETRFSSEYFTLSFVLPPGFVVRDKQNSIRIAKSPFTDRAIGDDNAFFGLTRYNQYNTQESELSRYRKLLVNLKESTIVIDETSFLALSGEDWGRFEGDSAGKVLVVIFPKSWLEIIERPANAKQSFDPLAVGRVILSTMRFSK